jgi:hypothetical protein
MLKTAKRRFPRRVNGGPKQTYCNRIRALRFGAKKGSHGCEYPGACGTPAGASTFGRKENHDMVTRERRLAEFNGNGEPPPDQPVQVLCEDHSGTYQLPFPCRWVDGEWRNSESGSTVEATVVGWRLPRL